MNNKVFVVECPEYDQAEAKIGELFDLMGGISNFAHSGESLALKVNLLVAAAPEQAVTTHPDVVAAVGRMALEAGAKPFIVDSPGGGYRYDWKSLDKTYRECGMHDAARRAGMEVNLDCSHREVSFPQGRVIKRFEIITPVLDADAVFNLCKLKTHMFTYMTGAVKNHFGVIPGLAKPGYHAKLKDTGLFAAMLLDLAELVGARLFLMDAVLAMEGEGPFAGDPKKAGLLLASDNPVALDAVAGEIIGLPRSSNPVLLEAEKRGWEPSRIEHVDLIGVDRARLSASKFKAPATIYGGHGLGGLNFFQRLLIPFFKDGMSVKPVVSAAKCVACGVCVKACPVGAVTINGRKHAHINDEKCIRCYCCHEMCQEKAVELKRGVLYRMFRPAA